MQRSGDADSKIRQTTGAGRPPDGGPSPARCYGVQVLVAGRRKRWRDEISGQVRLAGYQVTACDSAVDALAVFALGLPVDVLVADVALQGSLCGSRLAAEALAMRPGLRIVLASADAEADCAFRPDAFLPPDAIRDGCVVRTLRQALSGGPVERAA